MAVESAQRVLFLKSHRKSGSNKFMQNIISGAPCDVCYMCMFGMQRIE